MWNLLSQGSQATIYRPTAHSGTVTDPTKAYDVDAYPWATTSSQSQINSAVNNVPDEVSATYTTFGTLAKENFSTAMLSVVYTINATSHITPLVEVVVPAIKIEYSLDAGSTWSLLAGSIVNSFKYVGASKVTVDSYIYPAIVDTTTLATGVDWYFKYKMMSSVSIQSSSLSVGIQSLQVKSTCSAVKSATSGSSALCYIYDIQAEVS